MGRALHRSFCALVRRWENVDLDMAMTVVAARTIMGAATLAHLIDTAGLTAPNPLLLGRLTERPLLGRANRFTG